MSQGRENRGIIDLNNSRGDIADTQLSDEAQSSLFFSEGEVSESFEFRSERGDGPSPEERRIYSRKLWSYANFLNRLSAVPNAAEFVSGSIASRREDSPSAADEVYRAGVSLEKIRKNLPDSLTEIVSSATEVFSKETETEKSGRTLNNEGNFVEFISDFDYRRCEEGIVLVRCLNRQLKRLHIPANVLGTKVCAVEKGVFADCGDLVQVVIESGLQRIGEGAFKNCGSLGSITLPEGLVSVGAEAFCGCSSLKRIKLPASLRELGQGAFEGCSSLKKIALGDGFISVSKRCFYGCSELSEVSLPFGVCSIGEDAFRDCSSLAEAAMPALLREIGDSAFKGCRALERIVFSQALISVNNFAFSECSSLKSVELPEKLSRLGSGVFSNCYNLEKISLNNILEEIGPGCFSGCLALSEISLPAPLKKLGSRAFCDCESLRSIDLSVCDLEALEAETFFGCKALENIKLPVLVKSLGSKCFQGCRRLTDFTVPDSVGSLGKSCFEGCAALENLVLGGLLSAIPERLCQDCYSLKNVNIGPSTVNIGVSAFSGCKALEGLILPLRLRSISGRAFANCTALTEVSVNEGLEAIEAEAFIGCRLLASINIPASVKLFDAMGRSAEIFDKEADKLVISGLGDSEAARYAYKHRIKFYDYVLKESFSGFDDLEESETETEESLFEEAPEPEAETAEAESAASNLKPAVVLHITPMSYDAVVTKGNWTMVRHKAFEKKSDARFNAPTAVYLDDINRIGTRAFSNRCIVCLKCSDSLLSIGKSAFWGCDSLQYIEWSQNLNSICNSAFWGCRSLTELKLPDSLQSIDNWAFFGCSGLKSVKLPDYLISLGEYVFAYCSSLESIEIPNGVRVLGQGLFFRCSSLKRVVIPPSVKQFGSNLRDFAPIFGCSEDEISVGLDADLSDLTIVCQKDSLAHEYAEHFNIKCEFRAFDESKINVDLDGSSGSYIFDGLGLTEKRDLPWNLVGNSAKAAESVKNGGAEKNEETQNRAEDRILNKANLTHNLGALLKGRSVVQDYSENSAESGRTKPGANYGNPVSSIKNVFNNSQLFYRRDSAVQSLSDFASDGADTERKLKKLQFLRAAYEALKTAIIRAGFRSPILLKNTEPLRIRYVKNGESVILEARKASERLSPAQQEIETEIRISETAVSSGSVKAEEYSRTESLSLSFVKSGPEKGENVLKKKTAAAAEPYSGDRPESRRLSEDSQEDVYVNNIKQTYSFEGTAAKIPTVEAAMQSFYLEKSRAANPPLSEESGTEKRDGVTLARLPNISAVKLKVPDRLHGDRVIALGENFCKGNTSLQEIILGDGLITIGNGAFRSCICLRSAVIPDSVAAIQENAFRGCDSLTGIKLPAGLKFLGERAFCACTGLRTISIPGGLRRLAEAVFADCRSLETVFIGEGVESIGSKAFFGCRNLKYLFVPSSCSSFGDGPGDKILDGAAELTVIAPTGSPALKWADTEGLKFEAADCESWEDYLNKDKEGDSEEDESSETPEAEDKRTECTAESTDNLKKAKYLKRKANSRRGKRR
ncbi:leucine-rich repeat domain-containing protein [bacterium]|nr:leucine-rich repeat domain-containing protein [bacterium]